MWAVRASGVACFFEKVADFEVEVWEVGCAAEPVVVGVDIGEGTSRSHRDLLPMVAHPAPPAAGLCK